MMEVLLPKHLQIIKKKPTDNDIIFDISDFPIKPFRCTISCMDKNNYDKIIEDNSRFVDTSEWELTHALIHRESVWAFTLRISRNDKYVGDSFNFFVLGEIKWSN